MEVALALETLKDQSPSVVKNRYREESTFKSNLMASPNMSKIKGHESSPMNYF